MAATPSARTTVHTPSTPRYGAGYDAPHIRVTRRSVRQSQPARLSIPPPPPGGLSTPKSHRSSINSSTRSRPARAEGGRQSSAETFSRTTETKGILNPSTTMELDEPTSHVQSQDSSHPTVNHLFAVPTANLDHHMLPTPVKTPRKKQNPQPGVRNAGRILFPDRGEDPMPGHRRNKHGKRHVGFSLYGSTEDEAENANRIEIYTDSKDKIPDLDMSEDNPFLEQPRDTSPPPEPTKARISKKRKIDFGLDGNKEIEDAFNRNEGMVYVL